MADDISTLFTDRTETLFWAKVDKRGPDDCWLWTASVDRGGYGRFVLRDKRARAAHHLALHFDGRPRPDCLETLHSCDNRKCVNPAHLSWGTTAENAREKVLRGRHQDTSGEKHGRHKLTEKDVKEIRTSLLTRRELAERFGLTSLSTITMIKRRQRWKHIE